MRRVMSGLGVLLAAALAFGWTPEGPPAGPLDGKTYVGEMQEKGKAKADKDEFIFKDWKFRSKACDAYGFREAEYTVAVSDGATTFQVEARSPKEGTMIWRGTVKGDSI